MGVIADGVMFFGDPPSHYVFPENGHWPPICGDAGAEIYTHDEENVSCHDCAAILGIEPAGRPSQKEGE